MSVLVTKAEDFLVMKLKENPYFFEQPHQLAYRLEHARRVACIGRDIALGEGMDAEAIMVACLLRDVAYSNTYVFEGDWINHGRASSAIAEPFLKAMNLPPDKIQEIVHGIAIHVDDEAGFSGKRTLFPLSIGDADNIDRFGVYRIYESLHDMQFFKMELDEKIEKVNARLKSIAARRQDVFATETARQIWLERIDFNTDFFTRLKCQLETSARLI
jgi:uncharacterized protein